MDNPTVRRPRKVTIRDVARLAGVSASTVSAALSGGAHVSTATRRRVIDAADRLGWRPDRRAAGLRRFHSRQVGVIYEVAQSFQASLLDALYVAAADEGLDLILAGATVHHTEQTCVAQLMRDGCQAMVLTGSGLSDREIADVATRIPTLSLCRQVSLGGVDVVACDSRQGAATAVAALAGLGHRDIVHVNGAGQPMSAEREQGYVEAMTGLGLSRHVRVLPGGSTVEAGVAAAQAVAVMRPRPTAVTCFNDMCASAMVRQLRLQGIGVPEQISVVGFDDAPVASDPTTGLTSVRQDASELARQAARLLGRRVEQEGPVPAGNEQVIIIGTELVTCTTTSALGPGVVGRPS